MADSEKKHRCTWEGCGYATKWPLSLTVHMRTHTGDRPYKCTWEECGAAFTTSGHLTNHMRTHPGERSYRCTWDRCGAAFAETGTLTKHIRTHTGERPYRCQWDRCGAAFAETGALTTHMRTHTGVRPYRYTECGAEFAASGHLMVHMRTHTGERPYRCTECDAAFAKSAHLTSHARTHTPEYWARKKKEEERVRTVLAKRGFDFKSEHRIDFSCIDNGTFCRIDVLLQLNGGVIMLEIDEDQYKFGDYTVGCDMRRMAKVMETLALEGNTLPIYWLRYNPGAYSEDGAKRKRLKVLQEQMLVKHIESVKFDRPFWVHYMFYDVTGGCLNATRDPEYHDWIAECTSYTL